MLQDGRENLILCKVPCAESVKEETLIAIQEFLQGLCLLVVEDCDGLAINWLHCVLHLVYIILEGIRMILVTRCQREGFT